MSFLVELLVSILIVAGAGFALIGSIGLVRLPDFYTRLHAPTKATTLGMGCLLVASIALISLAEAELSVHELLITLFLFITAPVTAHMLAKTALHYDIGFVRGTRGKELASKARERVSPKENDE
ncbi:Na+/H+ antiporter subunit G [Hahella sp. CCB-MM4]|uniref:Na+/H+ antiporter subunit G n=1 Tax=Hahella sp. (strain CCB-MM4) TaxID=1926491 RepID=UPI000B9BD431|nr:Na+/H+ antiporter subunit G [Hahella sp. CCB-MM4]OZG72852.1 Na+/H+ antiporter subunit G [Hahella sp. CCB-MM4]